jgi:subtilase family serine protease
MHQRSKSGVFVSGRFVRGAVAIAFLFGMLVVGVSTTPVASAAEPGLPDLVVGGVSPAVGLNTWSHSAGERVVPRAAVYNRGTAATPEGTILGVEFKIDGTTLWSATYTASLATNGGVWLIATSGPTGSNYWVATEGVHTLTAKVNATGRIPETNLNNNLYSSTFTIHPPKTDLIVTAVGPASARAGEHVLPSATVKNIGMFATKPGVTLGVTFWIEDTLVWSQGHEMSLAPGASVTLTADTRAWGSGNSYWVATEGSHTITANVNAGSGIGETDRTNNTLTSTITVSP